MWERPFFFFFGMRSETFPFSGLCGPFSPLRGFSPGLIKSHTVRRFMAEQREANPSPPLPRYVVLSHDRVLKLLSGFRILDWGSLLLLADLVSGSISPPPLFSDRELRALWRFPLRSFSSRSRLFFPPFWRVFHSFVQCYLPTILRNNPTSHGFSRLCLIFNSIVTHSKIKALRRESSFRPISQWYLLSYVPPLPYSFRLCLSSHSSRAVPLVIWAYL